MKKNKLRSHSTNGKRGSLFHGPMKGKVALVTMLLLSVVLAGCTSDGDADGDGVPDDLETRGALTFVYGMKQVQDLIVKSDPSKVDTDGDGLDDFVELLGRPLRGLLPTNPSNADTDGDGLSDCQEFPIQTGGDCPLLGGRFQKYDSLEFSTDPLRADGDLAGPSRYNLYEINEGRGYLDQTINGDLLPSYTAIKGDGISDYDEIFGYDVIQYDGTIIPGVTSDPNLVDTDADGLEDGEEALLYGSDSRIVDTDGDGCNDGNDPFPDRVDVYSVEFSEFTFHGSDGFSGHANVVLVINIVDVITVNPMDGSQRSNRSMTSDFSALSVAGIAPETCTLTTPYRPWIKIQVVPHHRPDTAKDTNERDFYAGNLNPLDAYSVSVPEQVPVKGVWWNPRDDVYRLERPEVPLEWSKETDTGLYPTTNGYVELQGEEATLRFKASVAPS
jgi:hypothetical protein